MKIVAIHQPTFLPWLGYFHKIMNCEVFVVLDDVQFPKTGGSWIQRVKLLIGGRAHWMTVPVDRSYHGTRDVNKIQIKDSEPWRTKMLAAIDQSYRKAPFYKTFIPVIEELIREPETNLCAFNLRAIRRLWDVLALPPREIVLSSGCAASGMSNELLIALVKELGGTHYLCGGGSADYQDDALFAAHGITVVYQGFTHPRYEQQGTPEFVPGLSVIDALFRCGSDAVRAMLLRDMVPQGVDGVENSS